MEAQQERQFNFVESRQEGSLLSLSETAELMDYSVGFVRNLRYAGKLLTEQYGKRVFFWRHSIEAYMLGKHNRRLASKGFAAKVE